MELSTALKQSHISKARFVLETEGLSRVIAGKRLVDASTIGIQKGEVLAVVVPIRNYFYDSFGFGTDGLDKYSADSEVRFLTRRATHPAPQARDFPGRKS